MYPYGQSHISERKAVNQNNGWEETVKRMQWMQFTINFEMWIFLGCKLYKLITVNFSKLKERYKMAIHENGEFGLLRPA